MVHQYCWGHLNTLFLPGVEGRAKLRDCSLPETTQLAVLEPGLAHSFLIPVHFLCC